MEVETTGKSKCRRPLTEEERKEYKRILQDMKELEEYKSIFKNIEDIEYIEDTSNALKKQEEKRKKK